MKVYQMDPWRAPAVPLGATKVTIWGANFPVGEVCTVTIGTAAVSAEVVSEFQMVA